MKRFRFEMWEFVPQWELREMFIDAESEDDAREKARLLTLTYDLCHDNVEVGDCYETIYDETVDVRYELPDDAKIEEV